MRKWIVSALLASVSTSVAAQPAAPAAHSIAEDAAVFGAREAVEAPALSPDGSSVFYLTPGPGRQTVAVVLNLNTGASQNVISTSGDPEMVRWCNFASATRAVCKITSTTTFAPTGDLIGFSRLVASDMSGGNAKLLGEKERQTDEWIRQVDGSIIDWLGKSSGSVLMARSYVPDGNTIGTNIRSDKKGLGVDRVNATTLVSDNIEPPRPNAGGYITDGRGHVRIMLLTQATPAGQLTGRTKYLYRSATTRDWKTLLEYQSDDDFQPLTVDEASNALFALKKLNGRMALYSLALDGSARETLVASNPRVDIADVVRNGEGTKVIGYSYVDDKRVTVYTDPEYVALAKSLGRALPKAPLVEFVDASADGSKLLLFAGSDVDPGRFYLFDRKSRALAEAMFARPELKDRVLSPVKAINVTAPDGTVIPAYLTTPAGKEARNLPAVVLPHGGPSDRDQWGFDWLAQFLAARGYAVLQPQFRGSAGFGDSWLVQNGFKSWRTSIGDISASARWLTAQGIADPKRMAIVGWSYGGYAALQSATTDPSLYKAVVAIAPVTDLSRLKAESANFTNSNLTDQFIGNGPHLVDGSPLRHANQINVPVLLVHGDRDTNVGIAQSRKMQAALQSAGKQSELLAFRGLDHQLDDSTARTQMLTKIGELLDRTIGH